MMTQQHAAVSRERAEAALRRAQDDTAWLDALRRAYGGRHEVLDALWWAAHPLTVSPAGADDPAQALRPLQRAVFARPSAQQGTPGASERELHALQRKLTDDARQLRDAIDGVTRGDEADASASSTEHQQPARQAGQDAPAQPPVPTLLTPAPQPAGQQYPVRQPAAPHAAAQPSPARPSPAQPSPAQPSPTQPSPTQQIVVDESDAPALPRSRGRRLIAAGVAAAAVIAAMVFIPSVPSGDAAPTPPPEPVADQPQTDQPQTGARVQTEIVSHSTGGYIGDALEILERARTPQDQVDDVGGGSFDNATLRRLPDLAWSATMYLARGAGSDDVCLVIIRADDVSSRCAAAEQFDRDGLRVLGSDRYEIWPDTTVLTESFTLRPDGNFIHEITMRAPIQRGATTSGSADAAVSRTRSSLP